MSEAEFVEETEGIKAKNRQGMRADLTLDSVQRKNIPQKDNNMPTSGSFEPQVKNPERVRDKIAEQVGFGSGITYERAKKVWDSAKDGDETVKELLKKLTSKNIKITIFCKRF